MDWFMEHTAWETSGDGFSLCREPLAKLLSDRGIVDTGISRMNTRDVWSYFDDWHLFFVDGEQRVYSLVKLREQEYDYMPGFSDRDYPGVTVSFIPFDIGTLRHLPVGAAPDFPELMSFVEEFRIVTEYTGQKHSPVLQRYFSADSAEGPYLIAKLYVEKLALLSDHGLLPFPAGLKKAPHRIAAGLRELNIRAGRTICDFENHCIRLQDPQHLSYEESCCLLASHSGNMNMNSFAAEVKFHADALISPENKIPALGKSKWYASAIRADMQVEHDGIVRKLLFDSYHDMHSKAVLRQQELHGEM